MRLAPIPPENLSPELRAVHDEIAGLVARAQERIVVLDEQNALIGPFPAMLHFPQFGIPALVFQRSLSAEARLPKTVREVTILTVGAAFGARHLAGHPEGRAQHWRRFTAALDAVGLSAAEEVRATIGAEAAFARVEELVTRHFD